ncbi:ABC transporter ATP-binding protein [Pseudoalteromonas sp. GB56]
MNERKLAIQLKNVDYLYTQRKWMRKTTYKALENINLDIYKGETLGIEGRNGSGKSTLLKLLAGIYEPAKGSIERFGNHVSLQTLSAGFDVELSGEDNALIGAMLLGHSKKEAKIKRHEIQELSELGDKFFEPVKTYSAGMRARLGFATAITMNTDVLLIDEVLGVGDAKFREKAERIISQKASSDMTVVVVSHSAGLIKRLCNRVVVINEGKI